MLFVAGRLERDETSPRVVKVPSDGHAVCTVVQWFLWGVLHVLVTAVQRRKLSTPSECFTI